jgi:hypothetical protein
MPRKHYTPRELRSAVILAVLLTVVTMMAFFDPSCHPQSTATESEPSRAIRWK